MSSAEAELDVPRDGFVPRTDVARPDAPATSSIRLTSFEAQSNGTISWVAACYRGSAPGWNADVDELVEHRLAELAVWFAGPLGDASTLHVVGTETSGGVTIQRLEATNALRARTFLGFRDGAPTACVLSCGPNRPDDAVATDACPALVAAARLHGPVDAGPPREGALLGLTATMVHHPTATVATFVGLVAVAALALATRRRRGGPTRRRRTNF